MNILLLCNAGLSTSIVVAKMKKELGDENNEWRIEAHPANVIQELINDFDVVLIGPQIGYLFEQIKSQVNKPVGKISQLDYALGDGKKVLEQAIKLAKGNAL